MTIISTFADKINIIHLFIMKKLKRFNLSYGKTLSSNEMEAICGGKFLSLNCYYEGQGCFIPVSGGVNTGVCKFTYASSNVKVLKCIED